MRSIGHLILVIVIFAATAILYINTKIYAWNTAGIHTIRNSITLFSPGSVKKNSSSVEDLVTENLIADLSREAEIGSEISYGQVLLQKGINFRNSSDRENIETEKNPDPEEHTGKISANASSQKIKIAIASAEVKLEQNNFRNESISISDYIPKRVSDVTFGVMAVLTVAASQETDALVRMISQIRKTSGLIQVIVFDSGLSDSDKKNIRENVACEIRPIPEAQGSCKAPCKPHLVHSVILTHKVIVWMDVGYVQEWDLRLVLDGVAVGTSFVGSLSDKYMRSSKKVAKGKRTKLVSMEFFVVIIEVRFFNRVLLPWKQCAENRDIISSHLLIHGDIPLETLGSDAGHDVTLTALLRSYEALYPGSVLTNVKKGKSPFGSALYKGDEDPALRRIRNGSAVSQEPFLAMVPFFGPNNQILMTLHSAILSAPLRVRFLAPPLRKHSLKTDRANVSQDSPSIPADHFLSPHFLYRRGVLADKDSSWTELLPQVDFIIAEMDPKRNKALGFPPWRPCTHNNTCKVRDLMDNLYTTAFFQSIGMHRESKSSINVIECSGTPEECIQSSLVKRGRIAILFWCTVGLLRVNKDKYPDLLQAQFTVPTPLIKRGFYHQNACIAVHLRLKDTVPGSDHQLLNASCDVVLDGSTWGKRTMVEIIELMLRAASRRGLSCLQFCPLSLFPS